MARQHAQQAPII